MATRNTSMSSLPAYCQPIGVCFCALRVVDEPQLQLAPLAAVTLSQVGAPQCGHRVVGEVARSESAVVTRRTGGLIGRVMSGVGVCVGRVLGGGGGRLRRTVGGFGPGLCRGFRVGL